MQLRLLNLTNYEYKERIKYIWLKSLVTIEVEC